MQAELAASEQHRLVGPVSLGLARPSRNQHEVFLIGAGSHANFSRWTREIALQALKVIEDAQSALLAKIFQRVTLAAAQCAGLGDAYGRQRQAVPPEAREQIFDADEWRQPPVRLVGAVAAQGLPVAQARKGCRDIMACHLAGVVNQRLDHSENGFLLREEHTLELQS